MHQIYSNNNSQSFILFHNSTYMCQYCFSFFERDKKGKEKKKIKEN